MKFLSRFFLLFWTSALLASTKEEIAPGLIYQYKITSNGTATHILDVDPALYTMTPSRALDYGIGRELTSSMAHRHNAIAAVNGGFFQIDSLFDGIPRGVLKIGSDWYALPFKQRGSIGWSDYLDPVMDRLLIFPIVQIGETQITAHGLNRERKSGETIVYLPSFHRTTLTAPGGVEIIIRQGKVDQIIEGRGSSFIPSDGWVLSFASPLKSLPPIGSDASLSFQIASLETSSDLWQNLDYIVGGTPLLIEKGHILYDYTLENTLESFLILRHARTAVGILENGHWLFVVVEGKSPWSGMTIPELAEFMYNLGCQKALNLDGGGSSTLVIQGKIINHMKSDNDEKSLDNVERKVSDAILIHPISS